MLDAALTYTRDQRQPNLDSLFELLRIPSVSTLPEHASDMERAAGWLADYLREMGMTRVEIMPTGGYPVVYAEWLGSAPSKAEGAGAEAPTLLAYGHYDVQPVDPLDKWRTSPFEPTIQGDDLFCRGTSDDKGQLFAALVAAEAYLKTAGRLPINLKIILEGEEEISSPYTAPFVAEHRDLLAADAVLMCDSAMLDPNTPMIMVGVRGMAYMEVELRGPAGDLHSGAFGGAVDNPFNVLVRLLAQCQDPQTRQVTIPGFYDRVRPVDDEERELLAEVPLPDQAMQELTGVPALAGEEGYTTLEQVSLRPTFDIHGMPGGFTQPGKKTVIPARAAAKVSMRLVPDQDPHEIAQLFEDYLRSLAPPTVELEFRVLGTSRAVVIDYRHPAVQAAARACQAGFGAEPVTMRGGGSLRLVSELQDALGAPVVLMGFGLPDDNAHAPNEKIHLPNFYRGIETLVYYYSIFADATPS